MRQSATTPTISARQLRLRTQYGDFTVIGLRFRFDARLVAVLKAALHRHADRRRSGGGWSPSHRCWWVDLDIWPWVQQELAAAGYEVREAASSTDGRG